MKPLILISKKKGNKSSTNQQEAKEKDLDEVFQSHKEEQRITHSSAENNEDVVEELEPEDIKHDDEVLMYSPPSDESIQEPVLPA